MLPLVSAARQKPRLGHDTALSAWPGSMDSGALHESEESVSTPPLVSTARHVEGMDNHGSEWNRTAKRMSRSECRYEHRRR